VEITFMPSSCPSIRTPRRHTCLISLLNFLPCFLSFPLVTCRRHSPYLTPCATSTHYRTISHHRDSPSATLPSGLYIQPLYLLYLVRFELVGLYTTCTSHIPLFSESDPSSLCLCALVLRQQGWRSERRQGRSEVKIPCTSQVT